jgi:hypothetical protein
VTLYEPEVQPDPAEWLAVAALLGRPVSEYGRLCHGDGGHEGSHRCRRAFMLTCMKRLAVSSRGVSLLVLGAHRHG